MCFLNNSSPHYTSKHQEILAALNAEGLDARVIDVSEDIEMASKYPRLIHFYFQGPGKESYSPKPPYSPIVPSKYLPSPPGKTQHIANAVVIAKS